MILVVAATPIEMKPFQTLLQEEKLSCEILVIGVGPVETAVRLTKFLSDTREVITSVLVFGIGGAYIQPLQEKQARILDICLASQEILGDFGISNPDKLEYLPPSLTGDIVYPMDTHLIYDCRQILYKNKVKTMEGPFITVNGASGSRMRGEMLRKKWQGLCENMEGAAVARVCREFDLPCVELRCISNMVENRNITNWRVAEACDKAAIAAILTVKGLMG